MTEELNNSEEQAKDSDKNWKEMREKLESYEGKIAEFEAKERIKEHFNIFAEIIEKEEGIVPVLVIREGEKVTQVLEQVKEDPEVGIIVLGAGISSEGPGPLVTQLVARQGGSLPVPVTIVPGSMTKEAIISVS